MAPNRRITKAYKAMKNLGYSTQTVKPVLRNLLDIYDQNWQLIEDVEYTVLVDAILESEERKVEEKKTKKFCSVDETVEDEPPPKRNRSQSQTVQNSHSPCHYSPLCNDSTDKCGMEKAVFGFRGKQKITEPAAEHHQREEKTSSPNYASGLELKEKIQLISDDKSDESESLSPKLLDGDGDTCNTCSGPSSVCWEEKNVIHDNDLSNQENVHNNCHYDATGEIPHLSDDFSKFEVPLSIIPPDETPQGYFSNSNEKFSACHEVIDLDAEDTFSLSHEKDSACGDASSLEGHNLESKISAEEKNGGSDLSQIDVASSSQGAVKISMTFKFSHGSNFCVPSLEAVLRKMEEHCRKSYRITAPGFSMIKLMNDVCEEFSAAGTIAMGGEKVRPENVKLALVTPKFFHSELVLNRSLNHRPGFCIAPNLPFGNLIEMISRIPNFQGLNCLDLTGCNMSLTMSGAFGETIFKIMGARSIISSSSNNKMIIRKQHFSNDMLRSTYYVEDIARGENVEVSLINEFNDEHLPNFKYIPTNMTYQNAYVKFLLARISDNNCCSNCFGDCLSSQIPCACADETGGEFAYMPGGLLKETFLEDCISVNRNRQQKNLLYCQDCPLERTKDKSLSGKCKGHLFRKFIKECWYKCGCRKDCGNRVVQNGIAVRLQVFMTPEGKGWGLRTLENLPKGAFVCEYVGEIVTNIELLERNMRNTGEKHTYPVLLDAEWSTEGVLKDEEALCLDAAYFGNVARFINHRCYDASLVEIPVEVETPDHRYYHLAFFTTREINALEELTWDYGIDFDDHIHPVKAFQCHCGSQFCRDMEAIKN